MKILIHNYSSEISTEPMFLAQAFKNAGEQVNIWPGSVSAYDIFDSVKPDLFICKAKLLNKEIIKRLSESPKCKIVLNCEGLVKEQLPQLDSIIGSSFKYDNTGLLPIHTLMCFDPFLIKNRQKLPDYRAKTLSLIGKKPENRFLINKSSHVVSYTADNKDVDIYVPIYYLANIYHKYEEVAVDTMGQIAYDAAYYKGSCYVFDIKTNVTKANLYSNTPYDLAMDIFKGIGHEAGVLKMVELKDKFYE